MRLSPVAGTFTLALAALLAALPVTAQHSDHDPHRAHQVVPAGTPIAGESIYQLKMDLVDQSGRTVSLDSLRGRPVLITMFFASCQGVCPMIALTLKRMTDDLTSEQRRRLQVAMVSFDPQRDTPQVLARFAEVNGVANAGWLLAAASENSARELAAVLGVKYRPVNNGFSHSTTMVLLDSEGIIRAHTETLQTPDPQFMREVRSVLGE